jgi:hypothetical protein
MIIIRNLNYIFSRRLEWDFAIIKINDGKKEKIFEIFKYLLNFSIYTVNLY